MANFNYAFIWGPVGTFIVGYFLWRVQKDRVKLHYFLTETESFVATDSYLKFYSVKILSAGNKMIEAIDVDISFCDGKIDRITDDKKIRDLVKSDEKVNFKIDRLNPKDSLSFTITIRESKKGAAKPEVSISGKGATAVDKTTSQGKSKIPGIGWAVIGFIACAVYIIGLENILSTSNDTDTGGQPERIQKIFCILNKAKLSSEFVTIVNAHDDLSYVGTAFHLTHEYLKDTIPDKRYIDGLKLISQSNDIANTSKGTVYYLLYKIYKKEKNVVLADEYLQKCKNETPVMYEKFMEQDADYDLESLQKALQSQTN
ncbi:MAG: hypothetical protein ACJ77K_03275 [Bacteroidia bacterium]